MRTTARPRCGPFHHARTPEPVARTTDAGARQRPGAQPCGSFRQGTGRARRAGLRTRASPQLAGTIHALMATSAKVLATAKRVARRLLRARNAQPTDRMPGSRRFLEPISPRQPSEPAGPTIVLLNDCRDQVNFGSHALVEGLLRVVRTRVPDATILPIPSHWMLGVGNTDPYEDRGQGFGEPRVRYPNVADQFETLADDWMAGRGGRDSGEFLDRFARADLLLLNGEGSIYRDNMSAVRELFLVWLAKERLGIPTIFANGGVHLTDVVPVVPAMVRKTFPRLDAVAVREPRSLRNVQEYVPGLEALLFPDAAFVFDPTDARETEAVARVRSRIGDTPYFCFDPGPMPMDRRGAESALHRLISAVKGAAFEAVLVHRDPTDTFLEGIAQETGSVYVDSLVDFREYMAITSTAQFVVSGRYHNTILSAIMGCPAITFGSASHKVHGACELLDGVLGSPYDGTHLLPDLDAIVQRAHAYAANRDEWRDRLHEICGRRRSEVMGLGDLVSSTLANRARV
jgi:polysaccharide pyruvyl transferase WcaK-like protein